MTITFIDEINNITTNIIHCDVIPIFYGELLSPYITYAFNKLALTNKIPITHNTFERFLHMTQLIEKVNGTNMSYNIYINDFFVAPLYEPLTITLSVNKKAKDIKYPELTLIDRSGVDMIFYDRLFFDCCDNLCIDPLTTCSKHNAVPIDNPTDILCCYRSNGY